MSWSVAVGAHSLVGDLSGQDVPPCPERAASKILPVFCVKIGHLLSDELDALLRARHLSTDLRDEQERVSGQRGLVKIGRNLSLKTWT